MKKVPIKIVLNDRKNLSNYPKELGVYDKVQQDGGFGNVTSRDCGNMVTKAIEIAARKV